jgi:hypothetical protein
MADGNTLVLGTQAQDIVTVNEDTLAVTLNPCTGLDASRYGLFFPIRCCHGEWKHLDERPGAWNRLRQHIRER